MTLPSPTRTLLCLAISIALLTIAVPGSVGQTTQQPFRLTIGANKPTIKAGSDVVIWVELKNVSPQALECHEDKIGWTLVRYNYEVRSEDGKPVQKLDTAELDQPGMWSYCGVAPGHVVKIRYFAGCFYDLSKPGKYSIEASQRPSVDANGIRTGEWIKSNKITITVEK